MPARQFLNRLLCTLIFSVMLSSMGLSQEPILLRYKFQEGQVLKYETLMHDRYRIQQKERVEEPESNQKTFKSYIVKSVDADGNANIEYWMNRIVVDLTEDGVKKSFDTANPVEPVVDPTHQSLQFIVSRPYLTFRITPRGEMSEAVSNMHGETSAENTVASALEFLALMPDYAVKPGDRWKEDFSINLPLEENPQLTRVVKLQRQFLFKDLQGDVATIEVKSKVITPARDENDSLLMQTLRRTQSGTLVINTKTGQMVQKTLTQDNEVTKVDLAFTIRFQQEIQEKLVD